MQVYLKVIIMFSIILILKLFEHIRPLRKQKLSWGSRWLVNIPMAMLVYVVAFMSVQPVSHWTLSWTAGNHFGILQFIKLPYSISFIIGFLLMDLSFYYWHQLNHKWPLLWRFHNIHHIDPDLDISTAFRFHFIEILYSSIFRVIQLLVIGINPLAFLSYEIVFQMATFFQHSNIKLPYKLERILNWFIVTPRMHGIHHSGYRNETDSNYAVVFSFWDRLHNTIRLNIKQRDINIGVPGYAQKDDYKLLSSMTMPFKKQRNYWKNHYKRSKKSQKSKNFLED